MFFPHVVQLTLGVTNRLIPDSHLSVISETCTLYSTYKIMRDSDVAEFSHLTSLLQSTMTHGCLHVSSSKLASCIALMIHALPNEQVRELLKGEIPSEGEGSLSSCSELQFLDDLCEGAAQLMKQSVEETSENILTQYRDDEGLDRCTWLRENRATQYIRRLFRC